MSSHMKKRAFAYGGPTHDPRADDNPDLNDRMEPGPERDGARPAPRVASATPSQPQSFGAAFAAARAAGRSTFDWNGKQYSTQMAGGAPASAPAPRPSRAGSDAAQSDRITERKAADAAVRPRASSVPDERARLAARFGSAEARAKGNPNAMIPQADIDAAKAAGEARRATAAAQSERHSEALKGMLRRVGGALGTQAMRDRAKAEGYAAGGMVGGKRNRGDGCAQRGLTKGKMV